MTEAQPNRRQAFRSDVSFTGTEHLEMNSCGCKMLMEPLLGRILERLPVRCATWPSPCFRQSAQDGIAIKSRVGSHRQRQIVFEPQVFCEPEQRLPLRDGYTTSIHGIALKRSQMSGQDFKPCTNV